MKILLVCSAGMSTSLLVEKMKKYMREQGLTGKVEAVSMTEGKEQMKNFDVVFLAPQIRFQRGELEPLADQLGIPLGLIDSKDYGTMNAQAVVEQAQKLYEGKKSPNV